MHMHWALALRAAVGAAVVGMWLIERGRRPRVLQKRKLREFVRGIGGMPNDELVTVYADYAFISGLDSDPDVRAMRDACMREMKARDIEPLPVVTGAKNSR